MKRYILTIGTCLMCFLVKAQTGYNYAQYDAGLGVALNQAYTDAETTTKTPALFLNVTYNHTPFLNYIIDLQLGKLAGGDSINTISGRQFKNNYTAAAFRAQLQAGEFIDYANNKLYNALKNVYVSSGLGIIYNNMAEINRTSPIPGFISTGRNTSTEFFIPIKAGYEFKIFNSYDEPTVKIDLGYQYNYMLGDQLDGIKAGSRKDVYTQLVLGVKFAIGGYTSYRKSIARE